MLPISMTSRRRAPSWSPSPPLRASFAIQSPSTFLKLENLQKTGSFKVRGALNKIQLLDAAARARGVITASAGNHAQGVAYAAAALGGRVQTTLVVPLSAPRAKVEKLRRFPVTLIEHGANYDEAYAESMRIAERTGATYVHAYEHALTAAGQGTAALEILEALPDVGAILVPVGGGGLIAAIATVAKALLPVTLPIGGNFTNRYMAFGDSITEGEGSSGDSGYVDSLQDKLHRVPGQRRGLSTARVWAARPASRAKPTSARGSRRNRPAFTLILYGTNDWYECPEDDPPACFTVGRAAQHGRPGEGRRQPPRAGHDRTGQRRLRRPRATRAQHVARGSTC